MKSPLKRQFGTNSSVRSANDLYETPPQAVQRLLNSQHVSLIPGADVIWEPACGRGAISVVLESNGFRVVSTDLYDYGFGRSGIDFLEDAINAKSITAIITNPPYEKQLEFCKRAIELVPRVFMLLRLDFLTSKGRKNFIEASGLHTVFVFSRPDKIQSPEP